MTAVCVEPCVLLEISEAALDRIAERQPEIWRAIADFTYANMRNVLRMAAEVIALAPRQRIAARLLAAIADEQSSEPPVLKVSQDLLAEMTGVTRKTINLHLASYEREGLVDVGYRRITIKDVDGLRSVAEG